MTVRTSTGARSARTSTGSRASGTAARSEGSRTAAGSNPASAPRSSDAAGRNSSAASGASAERSAAVSDASGGGSAAALPAVRTLTMAKALNEGLRAALAGDAKTLLMGEDIGDLGGVYRVTEGLKAQFGGDRVMDTPLAESGIIGTAIGMALRGYRPICEIQFDGFVFPGFNQITTQLAKIRGRSAGQLSAPVVIRIPYGGGIGSIEHHSESPEALFAHTAGLRIISPATPQDAYWMIQQAAASPDPVIVFEPKRRYWLKGAVDTQTQPQDPFQAQVRRAGTDATLVTYGPLVPVALAAAEAAVEDGYSLEVIDLRSISPIDFDTITTSVLKTGRLIVTHEAPTFGGIGGEIAARIAERAFYAMQAPVIRVGGFHMPYPISQTEQHYLPDVDRILDAFDRSLSY